MRKKTTICPRCKKRPKGRYGYCDECQLVYWRELHARKKNRLLAGGGKACPCCGQPVDRRGMYCSKCAEIDPNKRRAMAKAREQMISKQRDFDALQNEARKIDWMKCRARGLVSKGGEKSVVRKKSALVISDFLGRDCEESLFQHM